MPVNLVNSKHDFFLPAFSDAVPRFLLVYGSTKRCLIELRAVFLETMENFNVRRLRPVMRGFKAKDILQDYLGFMVPTSESEEASLQFPLDKDRNFAFQSGI